MIKNIVNLIDAHFQNSCLFSFLPIFDEIYYEGQPDGKIQRYKAVREGQECKLLAISIIRDEENFLWDSVEDFMASSLFKASASMHGIFTFDLLAFDVHGEVKTFNHLEMMQTVINSSLKTKAGEQRLVKYSSIYGLLTKLVDEPWGKVTLKTAVEVYKDKPEFLCLLVKRILKMMTFSAHPAIAIVNDLSSRPLFDPQDTEQQDLLKGVIRDQLKDSIEFPPEVYIQDKNTTRELLSQTIVK